jgi:hypothetical protein
MSKNDIVLLYFGFLIGYLFCMAVTAIIRKVMKDEQ